MLFHGAFKEKSAAKKKERQVHGFIQPRNIRGQRRYVVMSERTNPIRRKAKQKNPVLYDPQIGAYSAWERTKKWGTVYGHGDSQSEAMRDLNKRLKAYRAGEEPGAMKGYGGHNTYIPGSNPMDLVVMGANPKDPCAEERLEAYRAGRRPKRNPEKEIVVEPGQTITFKFNPDPHVAEQVREAFVGEPADKITIYHEPHMRDGEYARLGQLVGISFKPVHGGQVQAVGYYKGAERIPLLEAAKKMLPLIEAPVLVSDDKVTFFEPWPKRIFFVGGEQDVAPMLDVAKHKQIGDHLWELGECRHIVYRERKWFDKFQLINYVHPFGEETGDKPTLLYNARIKRLLVGGGDYSVRPEGITN